MRGSTVTKILRLAPLALLLLGGAPPASAAEPITSLYSSLDPAHCTTLSKHDDEEESEQRCPGIGGYDLIVLDADARMSVTVKPPHGTPSDLNFTGVVTPNFSSLGDKAEWRVKTVDGKKVPIAVIVRLAVQEDPAGQKPNRSYLVVSRIDQAATCVTEKIPPAADANERARQSADVASTRPCLKPLDQ